MPIQRVYPVVVFKVDLAMRLILHMLATSFEVAKSAVAVDARVVAVNLLLQVAEKALCVHEVLCKGHEKAVRPLHILTILLETGAFMSIEKALVVLGNPAGRTKRDRQDQDQVQGRGRAWDEAGCLPIFVHPFLRG